MKVILPSRSSVMLVFFLFASGTVRMDAQSPDDKRALDFDRADRRSRHVIQTLLCAQSTAGARRQGLFGPVESLGAHGQCVVAGNKTFGVFFDSDTLFAHAQNVSAVNLATESRSYEALDTAAILAVARAERTALRRGMPSFTAANRQFSPVAFRFEADSIEVWLVPVSSVTSISSLTVGGELGMVFSPDGLKLIREINEAAKYRPVTLPTTGLVHIESDEEEVPTLTELLLANILNRKGRDVSIDMKNESALLSGEAWMHGRRSQPRP